MWARSLHSALVSTKHGMFPLYVNKNEFKLYTLYSSNYLEMTGTGDEIEMK